MKKKLREQLRTNFSEAFSLLDSKWNTDDLIVELFKNTGKLAVDYGSEMFNLAKLEPRETFTSLSIDEFVLQAIKEIGETKATARKDPDFAIELDLWCELKKALENSLRKLESENKIERLNTVNYFGFKRKENDIKKTQD